MFRENRATEIQHAKSGGKMILECKVIGKQDPERAAEILAKVASELIRDGKIKLEILNDEIKNNSIK